MSLPWTESGLRTVRPGSARPLSPKVRRGSARPFFPSRSFRAGARVGGVVHAHELLGANVRVTLRRRQAAVAEGLLADSKVGPAVEQVGGARVTQGAGARVRGDTATSG